MLLPLPPITIVITGLQDHSQLCSSGDQTQGLCVIGKHTTKCIKSLSSLTLSIIPGKHQDFTPGFKQDNISGMQEKSSSQAISVSQKSYDSSLVACSMRSNSSPQTHLQRFSFTILTSKTNVSSVMKVGFCKLYSPSYFQA